MKENRKKVIEMKEEPPPETPRAPPDTEIVPKDFINNGPNFYETEPDYTTMTIQEVDEFYRGRWAEIKAEFMKE